MLNQDLLAGKRAIVTGASGGLGEHFSRTLAKYGATVVLAARRLDRLRELQASIEASGGRALAIELDVTSQQSVIAAFEAIHNALEAPCDILINNSGVGQNSWFT